jgi:outer membrane receptor for ferrienterochelin and colicins
VSAGHAEMVRSAASSLRTRLRCALGIALLVLGLEWHVSPVGAQDMEPPVDASLADAGAGEPPVQRPPATRSEGESERSDAGEPAAEPTLAPPGAQAVPTGAQQPTPQVPAQPPAPAAMGGASASAQRTQAESDREIQKLASLSLDELLNITVVSATRSEQRLIDAPAPMVVITAEDIRDRGYTDLAEVISDLPGFDVVLFNGSNYINAYQRGYRQPYTTRTLLMINGIVDNTLWWQTAIMSRQYPLSNVERIEVLYGPASVVYGPNAFLGVINLITRDGKSLGDGDVRVHTQAGFGSWETRYVDAALNARWRDVRLSLSARLFRSDEPDLSDRGWGWLDDERYGNAQNWGPIVDRTVRPDGTVVGGLEEGAGNSQLPGLQNAGVKYGEYHDPTDDYGVLGTLGYEGLTLGLINWRKKEGYGGQYAADRAQSNAFWLETSLQVYAQYEFEPVEHLTSNTLLLYRKSAIGGDWAEAQPDLATGMTESSYVSFSRWNADNDSTLLRQTLSYDALDGMLQVSAGFQYQRKDLSRNFDISGYWSGSFSSVDSETDLGPAGLGPGIVHSSSLVPLDAPLAPPEHSPEPNRFLTTDLGGFGAADLRVRAFSLMGGVRYDHNSIYGSSVNPRAAAIYRLLQERAAVKLVFGTAFQEPPPALLYASWSGRDSNPDLKPERAYNGDLVFMMQTGRLLGDVSLFYAHYRDVVKEEAENAGNRNILGGELKARTHLPNFIPGSRELLLWGNLSSAFAYSSVRYDFDSSRWEDDRDAGGKLSDKLRLGTPLGDIAPVKLNLGCTLPILRWVTFTLRGNFVSERVLYLRNALRDPNRPEGRRDAERYFTLDAFARAEWRVFNLSLKVKNLLGADYFHPGVEQADSGDDFSSDPSVRSRGYRNSLVPQPERSFLVFFGIEQ